METTHLILRRKKKDGNVVFMGFDGNWTFNKDDAYCYTESSLEPLKSVANKLGNCQIVRELRSEQIIESFPENIETPFQRQEHV